MNAISTRAWSRVHEALDDRRDPFEDEVVLAACASDPEFAAAVLALCEDLAAIRTLGTRKSRARRAQITIVAAAALLIVALAVVRAVQPSFTSRAPTGRVIAWSSTVSQRVGGSIRSSRMGSLLPIVHAVEFAVTDVTPSREPSLSEPHVRTFHVRVSGP